MLKLKLYYEVNQLHDAAKRLENYTANRLHYAAKRPSLHRAANRGVHAHSCIMGNQGKMAGN